AAVEILCRVFYRPLPPPHLQPFVNPEWMTDAVFATDSKYFWRFIPDRSIRGGSRQDADYEIRINRDGFRGLEWNPDDPLEGETILAIGDSCVFGWDSDEGENFPERLIRHLEGSGEFAGEPLVLYQRGVPGYTSHQAKMILEEWGPKVDPDWIVLSVGTNDCLPCIEKNDGDISAELSASFVEPLLRLSYTALAIRDFMFVLGKNLFFEADYSQGLDFQSAPARVPLDHFEENLRFFEDYADRNRSGLILHTRQNTEPNPRLETYNETIREFGTSRGVPVVDVAARFVEYATSEVYTRPDFDPVHPNEKGYDLIAEWTAEAMRKEFKGHSEDD
ncbi:MAG: SGNH/GDSL hydrolase family protein, partial [Candidatus Omnitrophica bacterium]|nr:SGNH/GDSL hydrolase family protein [Candidatus Omnitrophota bacterium]